MIRGVTWAVVVALSVLAVDAAWAQQRESRFKEDDGLGAWQA
jgi:hypothetical protein